LQREYYYDGRQLKKTWERFFILLGLLGGVAVLYSTGLKNPQPGYIIGSAFLLVVAIHYKLIYFIALEMILISGHTAILLGIGPNIQVALPCLLSFQLFIYFLMTGQLKNIYLLIGISGIALLSIGFAYNNDWIFFLGSMAIGIYAFYKAIRGTKPCYLWAFLNLTFAMVSIYNLLII